MDPIVWNFLGWTVFAAILVAALILILDTPDDDDNDWGSFV